MKRPLTLSCFLCLLAAGPAAAQVDVEDFNHMGLLVDNELSWDNCLDVTTNQVYLVGLYLWNPMNESFGGTEFRPVQNVAGFECKLTATGTVMILARHFPVPAIDVGSYGSMIVGFGEPVPVHPDIPTRLVDLDVLFMPLEEEGVPATAGEPPSPVGCFGGTGFLWLDPAGPASIAGQLAFLDADDLDGDPLVGATPLTVPPDEPDLTFVPVPVPVAKATWGGVKSLYR